MSEQKDLSEEISENYRSECHNSDQGKFESLPKDLAYDENKSETFQSRLKQQKVDLPEDQKNSIERDIDCLSSKKIKVLLQAISAVRRDTKLSIEDIIQVLGISKIKSDFLKTVIERYREKDSINRDRIGNIRREIQTITFASRRYDNSNNYADIQNAFSVVFDDVISSDSFTHKFEDLSMRAQRENGRQDLLPFKHFLVAPDGDGDNDPEHTKLTVDPKPLGRSSFLVAPLSYLVKLKTKNEIQTEALTKEDFADVFKTIKPSIHKLSWNKKSEEVHELLKHFSLNILILYLERR